MNDKTGGPAFPGQWVHGGGQIESWTGMDLRDYFAGQCTASLINHRSKDHPHLGAKAIPLLAKYAYEYADALIAERSRP